jgi:hypothetical protein
MGRCDKVHELGIMDDIPDELTGAPWGALSLRQRAT